MNRKIRTGAFRSRGQTRPRLLRVCRAPAGVACSHGAGAKARRARERQVQQPHPLVGPLSGWLLQPKRGSIGQSAQTLEQDRRGHGQREPERPSGGETRMNTAVGIWASAAPLVKASGCPPNRVNPNSHELLRTRGLRFILFHYLNPGGRGARRLRRTIAMLRRSADYRAVKQDVAAGNAPHQGGLSDPGSQPQAGDHGPQLPPVKHSRRMPNVWSCHRKAEDTCIE